jgi:hypothetical protein
MFPRFSEINWIRVLATAAGICAVQYMVIGDLPRAQINVLWAILFILVDMDE